jgi:DNA repair exonuclease SbcCD nuclease subunit
MRSLVCATALVIGLAACDSGQPKAEPPPKTKSLSELKQTTKTDMSPEELEEARRKAGFADPDQLAKENIEVMRKGEREYVKTRLAEHRALTKTLRGLVDRVEKEAPKWPKAKDPAKAFEKFAEGYKEEVKGFDAAYKKLMEAATGIDVQAKLAGVKDSFELVTSDLGPELSTAEGFAAAVAKVRADLDAIDKELEAIEKDESLKVDETYVPEGGDAKKKK